MWGLPKDYIEVQMSAIVKHTSLLHLAYNNTQNIKKFFDF
jgi:hypothetical protein